MLFEKIDQDIASINLFLGCGGSEGLDPLLSCLFCKCLAKCYTNLAFMQNTEIF